MYQRNGGEAVIGRDENLEYNRANPWPSLQEPN